MTPEVFKQLSEEAHKALHRHHLHDALYLINILLKEVQLQNALEDCRQLEDSFNRMLEFLRNDGKDFNGAAQLDRMLMQALRLLIQAEREFRLQNASDLYSNNHRKLFAEDPGLQNLAEEFLRTAPLTQEREHLLDILFYYIWTSAPFRHQDEEWFLSLMRESTETEQCLHVSALTLALQEYPDSRKLQLLFQLLNDDVLPESVRIRLVTGIVLCSLLHEADTQLCTSSHSGEIVHSTLLRQDIQALVSHLNLAFLICQQTQSARERMEKDILPNFIKMAKDGRLEMGFDEEGDVSIDIPMDQSRKRQEMKHHLQEFLDMHRDGIDMNAVNMMAMRSMPFFQQLPHWLLPFDKERTEIRSFTNGQDKKDGPLGSILDIVGASECDTDRYGTLLIFMKHMQGDAKEMLSQFIKLKGMDGEEITDLSQMDLLPKPTAKDICRKYLQQLYRVFMMTPNHKEWRNPFTSSTNWLQNPLTGLALRDNREGLHQMTDFLVKYKNYAEAEAYLNRLVQLEGSDAETLRTAAWCKQQQGHFGSAISLYLQADILQPAHSWTLAQMQLCYAQLDKHEQRLECLLQLEQLEPDNAKVITETGLCLIQLQRWQEAAQRFFRLELEERRLVPSQRAIAWCSLRQGKHEQALRYYQKVLDSSASRWQDYLNAGHTAWVMGNTSQAVDFYKGYISHYLTDDPKITDALSPFNEDNELLLSLGKQQYEIDLMHDIIQGTMHNA